MTRFVIKLVPQVCFHVSIRMKSTILTPSFIMPSARKMMTISVIHLDIYFRAVSGSSRFSRALQDTVCMCAYHDRNIDSYRLVVSDTPSGNQTLFHEFNSWGVVCSSRTWPETEVCCQITASIDLIVAVHYCCCYTHPTHDPSPHSWDSIIFNSRICTGTLGPVLA